ncbi:MAG: hypothetical protein E6Q78_05260 [Rhodoferax sp.]|nr:MAG: hypothetical protein E6Q78_05260 [Rhodoferax sp.]
MATAFATLEARVNAAAIKQLANAEAILDGQEVIGIFDATPAIFNMLAGSSPTFLLASASVPADPRNLAMVIGATSYVVREYTHDGTGLCTLKLEAA